MPARTGSDTHLAITLSSTFDTIQAPGTGHKVAVDGITHGKGLTELSENPIGSGNSMQSDTATGDYNPTVSLTKTARTLDQGNALLSAFYGVETVATGTSGAYNHSMTHNANSITAYVNLGFTPDSANAIQYKNGVVTKIETVLNPNDFVKTSYELLFTDQNITGDAGIVFTAANLAASTEVSGRKNLIARPSHYVRMNAQAGSALVNGDALNIVNCVITETKGRELVGEIRGAAGYSAPRVTGDIPYQVEVALTFKNLADLTYYTAVNAGTEYKLDAIIQGDLIGGSTYNEYQINIPRLVIVTDPDFNPANAGDNELTIRLRSLVAASVPSGMFSVYPHRRIANTRSTVYWNN